VKSIAQPSEKADLLRRLKLVRPDSTRRWGRMTAHQMICHLRDAFLMNTVDKPVQPIGGWGSRTFVKWIALYMPVSWPAGIRTVPEVDQLIGGTKPAEFAADVAALEALIERVTSRTDYFRGRTHPIFGPMSDADWMRWGYLHVDHHLRQFGV
jgi:hypothetical protein